MSSNNYYFVADGANPPSQEALEAAQARLQAAVEARVAMMEEASRAERVFPNLPRQRWEDLEREE
jgi:hypothetical protein